MEYRGIQLDENVKLYRVNGEYNKKIKKSLDTFVNTLEKRNYKCIGVYRTSHTKVDLQCNKGHVIPLYPNDFNRGIGCRKCFGTCPEEAEKDFIALVKRNGHILLSDYINTETKVLIDFQCNHEPHLVTPHQYKTNKSGCPLCANIKTGEKLSAEAKAEFPSIVQKRGHKLLSEYERSNKKILIDFNCSHGPHWIEPDSYKNRNQGCPKCADLRGSIFRSMTYREGFPSFVESKGHILLIPYGKRNRDKVLIDFKCDHDPHWITPHDYKHGYGCPDCGRQRTNEAQKLKNLKAKKEFSLIVKSKGHRLLTPYKSNHEKVLIDFNCKHEPHWITPGHYKSNKSCPHCSESKGEKIIREWLETNKIAHFTQFKLTNKRWKYDFYIPSENLIVEVQGKQHFQFVEHFHKTRENFYKQANEYNNKWAYACNTLGYNYMEVDYRESKPELALDRFLEEFNELQAK